MASKATITTTKSHNLPNLIGQNFKTALNQSMEALSSSLHNLNSANSKSFTSEFRELVQSKADPPMESIWIYASLTFSGQNASELELSSRVSAIKDLFQLIASCSASCHPVKSLVLVAPVVYNLHNLITDMKGIRMGSKKEKRVGREIKYLLDSILSYSNVCFNGFDGNLDGLDGLVRPLEDLISFWTVDGVMQNREEALRMFFPLLGDEIVKMVDSEECQMIDLAGFVATEALLLKLCWKIREDGFGENIQNEIKYWVVGSLTGLQSSYVYVSLLSMLLAPPLPASSIMNAEYEDGLRKVLLDALILVEYSFLSPGRLSQLSATQAKRIMLTKLIATHEAIEFSRKWGDHRKVTLYSTAFTSSSFPVLITKWLKKQYGNEFSINEPKGFSPSALLRWMLNIESRGAQIFDDYMSKLLSSIDLKQDLEQISVMEQENNTDTDLLFYIDNKGQEEDTSNEAEEKTNENLSDTFMAAARSIQSSDKGEGRKRKTKHVERKNKVKFVKYGIVENSSSRERSDGVQRSGSDVENPSSDEED